MIEETKMNENNKETKTNKKTNNNNKEIKTFTQSTNSNIENFQNKTILGVISMYSIFFTIGIIFIIITFFSIVNLPNFIHPVFYKNDFWFLITIFIILFFVLSFGYIYGFLYIYIFNGTNHSKAIKNICLCVFIILFPIFVLLQSPVFVKIFENSIGYFLISFFQGKTVNELFTINTNIINTDNENTNPTNITDYVQQNKTFLLTLFTIDTYHKLMEEINKNQISLPFSINNSNNNNNDNLIKYIYMKNRIGKLCWIYLASVISAIVSIKYIVHL